MIIRELPKIPKRNRDGKISLTWLKDYITSRYSQFDPVLGQGAELFFNDLFELELINLDKIEFDEEQTQSDDE